MPPTTQAPSSTRPTGSGPPEFGMRAAAGATLFGLRGRSASTRPQGKSMVRKVRRMRARRRRRRRKEEGDEDIDE
eukprot:1958512-Pyramimonas_sp.AAC.1